VIAKNNKLNCDSLVATNNKNKKHAKDWIGSLKESRLKKSCANLASIIGDDHCFNLAPLFRTISPSDTIVIISD
jgi:hypothetical protein